MSHPSAKAEVLQLFPQARVVRATFGLVVNSSPDYGVGYLLGGGRAHWEEEAWLEALNEMTDRARSLKDPHEIGG